MAVDQTARKSAPENVPVFRAAPHNIEAEQALLGAILVNNEAFYRVSDFLEPAHFFAPVDLPPREQIEDAERRLYELAETGRYDGGFQRFATALTTAVDVAAKAYQRDGNLSGLATGITDLDRMLGGLQKSDLVVLAGR